MLCPVIRSVDHQGPGGVIRPQSFGVSGDDGSYGSGDAGGGGVVGALHDELHRCYHGCSNGVLSGILRI